MAASNQPHCGIQSVTSGRSGPALHLGERNDTSPPGVGFQHKCCGPERGLVVCAPLQSEPTLTAQQSRPTQWTQDCIRQTTGRATPTGRAVITKYFCQSASSDPVAHFKVRDIQEDIPIAHRGPTTAHPFGRVEPEQIGRNNCGKGGLRIFGKGLTSTAEPVPALVLAAPFSGRPSRHADIPAG